MKKNQFDRVLMPQSAAVQTVFRSFKKYLFLVAAVFVFAACSDDDGAGASSSDYYFRASIDGREVNFHTVNFQGGGNDGRWEHIVVGGYETSYPTDGSPIPPSLDFEIWKQGGNIAPGTYSTPTEELMIARYAVYATEGTLYNTSWQDDVFTVNIEAISEEGIKGTFEGTVSNQAGATKTITNGSFNLPYEDLVNP